MTYLSVPQTDLYGPNSILQYTSRSPALAFKNGHTDGMAHFACMLGMQVSFSNIPSSWQRTDTRVGADEKGEWADA